MKLSRFVCVFFLLLVAGHASAQGSGCDGCTRTLAWTNGPLSFGVAVTYGAGCSDGYCQLDGQLPFSIWCDPVTPCKLAFFDILIETEDIPLTADAISDMHPAAKYAKLTLGVNSRTTIHIGAIGDPQTDLDCGSNLEIIKNIGGPGGDKVFIECPECTVSEG